MLDHKKQISDLLKIAQN